MRRWIPYLIVALLFTLLAAPASAHTGVKSVSPGESETVTVPLSEINITFNTVIEPLSSLTLTNEQGEELEFAEVTVGADSIQGIIPEPLASGVYTVGWRIIGEDGHAVSGDYSFTVQAPAPVEEEAVEEDVPEMPAEDPPAEVAEEDTAVEQPAAEPDPIAADAPEPKRDSTIWIGGAVVLVLAAIIIDRVLRRKQK